MARRRSRNPRIGKRGRTADLSDSDAVFSSDSDYVVDLSDEDSLDDDCDDEEQRIHQIPFVPAPVGPPPPSPPAARRRHRQRRPRASVAVRRKRGEEIFLWENLEEEYSKWLDDHNPDDQQQPAVVSTADPPKEILLPLLRFQKEWLFWALKQEESEARGGILADEMGMGKTIQAISLVLTARSLRSSPSAVASCSSSSATSLPLPRAKATLVICPVVAVIQWVGEIEQHTERGSARVLVYHGQKRANNVYDFNDYDFVLTTYSTIESDFRKYIMLPKEKCPYCEKLFYPKKLRIHQKYFCGPHAQKTALQSKQGKKKRKVHSALVGVSSDSDGGKGNGKNKKKVYEKKNEASMGQNRGKSVLHSVKWERIILDECRLIL